MIKAAAAGSLAIVALLEIDDLAARLHFGTIHREVHHFVRHTGLDHSFLKVPARTVSWRRASIEMEYELLEPAGMAWSKT